MKIAYLFSRYPAVSHTFCDTEMLAHEQAGLELEIDVVRPPLTSFRHGHAQELRAPIFHLPPPPVLRVLEGKARREGLYPTALVQDHEQRFGAAFKVPQRARNALGLAKDLQRRGVDWVHVHFANRAAHTALFVKALSGIPFSITAHGQDFMADLGHPGLLAELCREAAFIVTVSDFSRELLVKSCPEAEGKVFRVHNGINLEKFSAAPPAEGTPRLLSVGRLVAVKGHRWLIEACAELRRQGLPFRCDIVGEGPERGPLQALIAEHGLADAVRLTGSLPQEEVARRLAASDLFVLPSIVDTQGATDILPTVILEAMAAGRPVVASAVGGLPEMVAHERTGLLVPPEDAPALAGALATLLRDPERRLAMGRAARAAAETQFDVARSTATLRELFARHAPAPAALPPRPPSSGLAVLIPSWSGLNSALREDLLALRGARPGTRLFIARLAPAYAPHSEDEELFDEAEFLPDGMVLEGAWQEERAVARQLELWRNELTVEADEYLTQARWALYLRRWIARNGVRHLHLTSTDGLPCAWMLRRLCSIGVSVAVEEKCPRPPSQLHQLMQGCRAFSPRRPSLFGRRNWSQALLETVA